MKNLSQLRRRPLREASPALILTIVCAGVVMASLDLFVVNVALPEIARDLGDADIGTLSWIINGYAITYAALLVLLGSLAERHRRERAFLLGVGLFVAASALCAMATTTTMLIAFRVLQAAGAALLTPASLSLVLATAPAERRAASVRAWAAIGGLAAAVGPVVGGLLVAASWRWVFLINLPVGLVAIAVGWRNLPAVPGHPGPRPDAIGALLVTAGVGLLALGVVNGGAWGWGSTPTLLAVGAGAVTVASFAGRCLRRQNPLVDPALFRFRSFRGASLVTALFSAAFSAMLLSIVLWQQDVWGWSALRTGLAVAPGPLMVPIVSFLVAGRLIARSSATTVTVAGTAAFAAGVAWWTLAVDLQPDYLGGVFGGMLLTGVGVGLALPTLMASATGSLPPTALATGSGVVNMLRQIGLALGVAVLVALLEDPTTPQGQLAAFHRAWWVIGAVSLLSGVLALSLLGRRRGRQPVPDPVPAVHGGNP